MDLKRKIKLLSIIILFFTIPFITIKADTFSGWIHIIDISNPITLEEIKSRYTAYDKKDGDISHKLNFKTTYNHRNCRVGEYDLLVSVTNSKRVTSSQIDKIIVRDFIPPTITINTDNIILEKGTNLTKDILNEHLKYYDNLDDSLSNENIYIDGECEDLDEGLYTLIIYVLDSSTNKSNEIEITLEIIDSTINTILPITLDVNKKHTKEEIINLIKNHTTIPEIYKELLIESSYFNDEIKDGIYPVKITIIHEDGIKEIITFKLNYLEKNQMMTNETIFISLGFIAIILICILIYFKRSKKA